MIQIMSSKKNKTNTYLLKKVCAALRVPLIICNVFKNRVLVGFLNIFYLKIY